MLTITIKEYSTFMGAVADHPMNPGEIPPAPSNPFELAQEGEDYILCHTRKIQTYKIYNLMGTLL
jgi:hypothetical protein